MESSQPLATESFSYSWLIDRQPSSSNGLINNLKPMFCENSNEDEESFNFDVPLVTSPSDIVHADEIFSDGQIMPVYVDRTRVLALKSSTSAPASPIPLYSSRSPFLSDRNHYYIPGKWRRSSKKILQKCFRCVKALCKTIGCSRKSSRVDDLERKVFEVQSFSNSLEASPRESSAYSVVEWDDFKKIGNSFDLYNHGLENLKNWRISPNMSPCRSSNVVWCDAENLIHEAILYCKRSIEK